MLEDVTAAIQSIGVLKTLVTAAIGLKNHNEFLVAISDANSKLMAAHSAALAAQEKEFSFAKRISELEQKIVQLENWESEAKRYQLKEVTVGVFAYVLKPGMEFGEPPHMLCANCFSKRQKGILQLRDQIINDYTCHNCNAHVHIRKPRVQRDTF